MTRTRQRLLSGSLLVALSLVLVLILGTARDTDPPSQALSSAPVLSPVPTPKAEPAKHQPTIEQTPTKRSSRLAKDLVQLEIAATRSSDIRFAAFLSSLDGYTRDQVESVRRSLARAEAERAQLMHTIDFAAPNANQLITEQLANIERTQRTSLAATLSPQELDDFDSYLGSINFRERLPNLRSELLAHQFKLSEDQANTLANAYQRTVSEVRQNEPSGDLSFDERFLGRVASVLDDETFSAFSQVYLDYQFE